MAEPKIGNAALKITIDKAQVAAEAAAAINPAMEAAAQQASKTLTQATSAGPSSGIQAMIAQQQKLAAEARAAATATAAAIGQEAAAAERLGNAAQGAGPKIRGLGAAASSVGGSFGGAAGEATRLASVLAYGGIAGAAAIGVSKLAEFGNSLNDTERSLQQLAALGEKTSNVDLVRETLGAVTFGDIDDKLKQLAKSGPEGVGVVVRLRQAYADAGQDTKKFDEALQEAATAQENLTSTTEIGQHTMDGWGGSVHAAKLEADALAESARRLESATRNQASAASQLITSQTSIVSAHNRVQQAQEKLANFGTESTGRSARQERDLAAAVENASQRIIDAQQHIIDARQRVVDAQEKLAEAGTHELLDAQDAQDAVDAAQRKLNASTPEERGPAQHALDDAKQKLEDAKKALEDAKPDAERALADAVRGVADASRAEADAHRQLADAQDAQAESSKKATAAQGDYQAAVDDVNDALIAQAQAIANQKQIQIELATGLKVGPVEALGLLKQALKDIENELDPNSELAARITYLLASMSPEGAKQVLQIATGGKVARFAAGGTVAGGQVFEGAEEGPELLLRRGRYQAPPGGGEVVNARGTAAILAGRGDVHHHLHQTNYVTVVTQAEPAERAVRRELERFAALAAG